MHAALDGGRQAERAAAARGRAARVPDRLAGRGEPARQRGDGRVPRSPPRWRRREPMEPGRYRETEALFARARRVVPGGIYGHQSPRDARARRVSLLLRARRRRAHLGRRRQRVHRPHVLVRADRPRPQPPAGRRGGAPAGGDGQLLQRPRRRCGSSWPSGWSSSRRGPAWAVFAKNGSDVCTWATQVARAATGRRKVLAAEGAYHGTHRLVHAAPRRHDARGSRPRRRTSATTTSRASTRRSPRTPGDVAAIIVTPVPPRRVPRPGAAGAGLPRRPARALRPPRRRARSSTTCAPASASHLGGSGERVGVQPDLTCYCKALANGYPISAASAARRSATRPSGLLHRLVLDEPGADGGGARLPGRARGERRDRPAWSGSARSSATASSARRRRTASRSATPARRPSRS